MLGNRRQNDILRFTIAGGYGIFVSKVEPNSKAERLDLRRGDQILEVNGINSFLITYAKTLNVLRFTAYLQLADLQVPFM